MKHWKNNGENAAFMFSIVTLAAVWSKDMYFRSRINEEFHDRVTSQLLMANQDFQIKLSCAETLV
jgi:hypothetical protein